MSATDTILQHNAAWAERLFRGEAPGAPTKHVAVVACMDCRLDVPAALGLQPGEAHVLRNAGGLASDDVLRSLILSQRLLGTREIMLVHHTRCGLLGLADGPLLDAIERESGSRPPFAMGGFADVDADVRASIACLVDCPWLPHRDAIRGFVYDVETGRLREVS